MRKLTAVSLAVLLLASSPVLADTSPEGAAAVKKQVEEALAFPLNLGKNYGQGLTLKGAVDVSPKGEYYEVTLPGAQILAGSGFNFDIGTVIVNVTPGSDGSLKAALAIPATIRALDGAGAPIAEIKVGSQRFGGTWWPELAAFTQLDAEYKDITFKSLSAAAGVDGEIASVNTYVNLTKNADGTWSGPYGISGSGLRASVAGSMATNLTVGSFKADSTYDKINLKSRKDVQDGFNATLAKNTTATAMTPENAGAMLKEMMGTMSGFLDGMGSNFELNTVNVEMKGDPAQPSPLAFRASIDKAAMAFNVTGMLQEKGNTSFKMALQGLKPADVDPAIAGVVPNNLNVEINLENLPMKSLGATLSNAMGGLLGMLGGVGMGQVDPAKQAEMQQQAQMQMMGLMASVPGQLVGAGTQLTITNTYSDAADFDANVDGAFKASATSAMMAEGKLTVVLKGLDELILKLNSLAQQSEANAKLGGYATALSMLQVYTKPEQGPDGKSARKLVLEISPQGAVLLNGEPMQGLPGGAPPQ